MSEKQVCSHCGQVIPKLNPHQMDRSKVALLMQIAKINREHPWVKIQQDHKLIKAKEATWTIQTDAVHASRLTWFELLERKEHRSGLFRVTDKGLRFLGNHATVPMHIYCKKGVVVKRSEEYVSIGEVRGITLDKEYWDNYASLQQPEHPDGRLF